MSFFQNKKSKNKSQKFESIADRLKLMKKRKDLIKKNGKSKKGDKN